jgi:hypothetical protein
MRGEDGFVGTSFDTPTILAPNLVNHKVSHDPLKPVWPVIRTFFPL